MEERDARVAQLLEDRNAFLVGPLQMLLIELMAGDSEVSFPTEPDEGWGSIVVASVVVADWDGVTRSGQSHASEHRTTIFLVWCSAV